MILRLVMESPQQESWLTSYILSHHMGNCCFGQKISIVNSLLLIFLSTQPPAAALSSSSTPLSWSRQVSQSLPTIVSPLRCAQRAQLPLLP